MDIFQMKRIEEKVGKVEGIITAYREAFKSMETSEKDKLIQSLDNPLHKSILLQEWALTVLTQTPTE